jgi:molecular chaperone GrpE
MSEKKKIDIQTHSEKKTQNAETEAIDENNTAADENEDTVELDDPVKKLAAELESKEKEAQETYDRLLRISAEFENYKKRTAREAEEFRKYANQALIKEMLSVVDNLELAIRSSKGKESPDDGLVEGLDMTHKEILRVFEKFKVTPIDATGQPFDPNFHEAVMQEETDDNPENMVINEFQKGYMIHDRLLRPAMVVVAKPKTDGTNQKSKENK